MITTQAQQQELGQFILMLSQHIEEHHPEILKSLQLATMEFSGMMLLSTFATDDGSLGAQQKQCRERIAATLSQLESGTPIARPAKT